jgi:HSP20 family molecular chaperone IbpA
MANTREIEETKRKRYACCNIFQGEDRVVLTLEMPGVDKEHLDIKVDNDILKISGKKNTTDKKGKYLIKEIRSGDYYQEYTLDDTIDRDSIDAAIKNGVVTLILNLKESVKPRTIKINAG